MIDVTKTDGVARLRLNRPERLNALSPALLRDLISICETLTADDSVRVVTVEGAGDHFSAGADLPEFGDELAAAPGPTADLGRVATEAVARLPQITVATIRGHCVGGAVVLASVCDVRVCSETSRFRIPELEAGIPLAWGGMAHLVRLVGETLAADLVLSCRVFGADEALRAGFVSRVVPDGALDREAAALAGTIASRARLPLVATKRQLRALRAGTFDAADDAEALLASLSDPEAGSSLDAYTDRLR